MNISYIDPDAQVILYGSRARGDARMDSDWDILILTDYPVTNQIEKTFRDHLYDLELEPDPPGKIFNDFRRVISSRNILQTEN